MGSHCESSGWVSLERGAFERAAVQKLDGLPELIGYNHRLGALSKGEVWMTSRIENCDPSAPGFNSEVVQFYVGEGHRDSHTVRAFTVFVRNPGLRVSFADFDGEEIPYARWRLTAEARELRRY